MSRPATGRFARACAAVLACFGWAMGAHALDGIGYGPTPTEARQRAAADLVTRIQVKVQAVVESCTQVANRKVQDCGSRVLRRTAADLPMLGLRYVDVPGEGERYGSKAVLDPVAAAPLYRRKLADLQRECAAGSTALSVAHENRVRYDLLTRQVACLRAFADHRLVAVALGDTVEDTATSETDLLAELATLEQTVDSIPFAARLLLKDVDGHLANVEPIMPAQSAEVTQFSSALMDALRAERGKGAEALTAKGEYRILEDGRVDATIELRSLIDARIVAVRTARLSKAACAGYQVEPLAPSFERLLNEGVVLSGDLRVDVTTAKGGRDLLFREGETIRLLARLNHSAYFYVVGHVLRPGEQFSYLLPLDGEPAGGNDASRFVRFLPPDQVNHLMDLGEFEVLKPFGTESVQVFAATRRDDVRLPATRYDAKTGYHVIEGSVGNASHGLAATRGIIPKRTNRPMVSEGTLIFTTQPGN